MAAERARGANGEREDQAATEATIFTALAASAQWDTGASGDDYKLMLRK